MNTKYAGPFLSAFETDPTGVVKKEIVTYRVKNGILRKETTTRKFNSDQTDWHDSQSVDPMMEVK